MPRDQQGRDGGRGLGGRRRSSVLLKQGWRAAARPTTRWRSAPRALALSSQQLNHRKIVDAGALPLMYSLARLADTDVQAEAATVIANVTSTRSEVQLSVCRDGASAYCCTSARRRCSRADRRHPCDRQPHAGDRRRAGDPRGARGKQLYSCPRARPTSSGRRSARSQTSRRVASSSASAAAAAPRRRSSTRASGRRLQARGRRQRRSAAQSRALANVRRRRRTTTS